MIEVKTRKGSEWDDLEDYSNMRKMQKVTPMLSINESGVITLFVGFVKCAAEDLKEMTHCVLSYSPSQKAIVFNFTDIKETVGAYKITKNCNLSISGIAFLEHYGILKECVGKYLARYIYIPGRGNCWTIFLREKKK